MAADWGNCGVIINNIIRREMMIIVSVKLTKEDFDLVDHQVPVKNGGIYNNYNNYRVNWVAYLGVA